MKNSDKQKSRKEEKVASLFYHTFMVKVNESVYIAQSKTGMI